jgi:hypothetical protein
MFKENNKTTMLKLTILFASVIKSCYAKKPQQDFAKKDVTVQ